MEILNGVEPGNGFPVRRFLGAWLDIQESPSEPQPGGGFFASPTLWVMSDDSVPIQDYVDRVMGEVERRVVQMILDDRATTAQRFDDAKEAVAAALASAGKLADVLESASKEWRAGSNEWRDAMTDREARFVQRIEFNALEAKVADLATRFETYQAEQRGGTRRDEARRSSTVFLFGVLGAIGVVTAIVLGIWSAFGR